MIEPELITIVEGPTPEFRASPQLWMNSIYEGPMGAEVATCELRTLNGPSILERCREAWQEGRPVRLDFPDQMRDRQQIDVIAMRLQEVFEGKKLVLWVSHPLDLEDLDDDEEEEFDDGEDDFYF